MSESTSTTTSNERNNKIKRHCKDNSKEKSQRIGKKITNSDVKLSPCNEVETLDSNKKH